MNHTLSIAGDRVAVLLSSGQTGGRTAAFEILVPPSGGPPLHVHHREDEAFHILEGTLDFIVEGSTVRVSAGGSFFAPRDIPHRFHNATDRPVRMLVWVTPGGLEKYFAESGTPLPSRDSAPVPPTEADIARLIELAPKYGLEILAPR